MFLWFGLFTLEQLIAGLFHPVDVSPNQNRINMDIQEWEVALQIHTHVYQRLEGTLKAKDGLCQLPIPDIK